MTKGQRIKKARTDSNLSQVELANLINVSKQNLYKYENDIITNIPSDKIAAIAFHCNTTAAYLMGWEDSQERPQDISKTKQSLHDRIDNLTEEQAASFLAFLQNLTGKQ